jgi:hypothetical protein
MITRDEWDGLTPDEQWDKYRADYFAGFHLGMLGITKEDIRKAAEEAVRKSNTALLDDFNAATEDK